MRKKCGRQHSVTAGTDVFIAPRFARDFCANAFLAGLIELARDKRLRLERSFLARELELRYATFAWLDRAISCADVGAVFFLDADTVRDLVPALPG